MSHVVEVKTQITDLEALEAACEQLGLELVREQKTFKWWGRWVGDYPLPEGFSQEDLGKCEHAIRVKNDRSAYEVGLVKSRTGDGFALLFDFYGSQGRAIEAKAGERCSKLVQRYAMSVVEKTMGDEWSIVEEQTEEGELVATLARY